MARLSSTLMVGLAMLAAAISVAAQGSALPPRVAVVLATSTAEASPRLAALRQGLRDLGYVEGRNVSLDVHAWSGGEKPIADRAGELVLTKPALIVAEGNPAIFALKRATSTIPIVMTVVADPVGSGLVASLGRPGGNITGLSNTAEQLSSKRLEVLGELVPGLKRVAVLRNPTNPTHAVLLRETEAAARALGMTLFAYDFRNEGELEAAFAAMTQASAQAAIALPQPIVIGLRGALVDQARSRRMPMVFHSPEPVQDGGLAAYGPSPTALWQRAAHYVDRILKGGRPGDLPIEQPTRFDLVLNLKAAKALGLVIPPSVLLRADRVIE